LHSGILAFHTYKFLFGPGKTRITRLVLGILVLLGSSKDHLRLEEMAYSIVSKYTMISDFYALREFLMRENFSSVQEKRQ
jgi:hypothetical protein